MGDKSYESIMNKPIKFAHRKDNFSINTPSKNEFDLYEFLKFVENQENIISEVNR